MCLKKYLSREQMVMIFVNKITYNCVDLPMHTAHTDITHGQEIHLMNKLIITIDQSVLSISSLFLVLSAFRK